MVKISDRGASEAFGIEDIPCLVYFESGVPEVYKGDLLNDNAIMKWMMSELKQVSSIFVFEKLLLIRPISEE